MKERIALGLEECCPSDGGDCDVWMLLARLHGVIGSADKNSGEEWFCSAIDFLEKVVRFVKQYDYAEDQNLVNTISRAADLYANASLHLAQFALRAGKTDERIPEARRIIDKTRAWCDSVGAEPLEKTHAVFLCHVQAEIEISAGRPAMATPYIE